MVACQSLSPYWRFVCWVRHRLNFFQREFGERVCVCVCYTTDWDKRSVGIYFNYSEGRLFLKETLKDAPLLFFFRLEADYLQISCAAAVSISVVSGKREWFRKNNNKTLTGKSFSKISSPALQHFAVQALTICICTNMCGEDGEKCLVLMLGSLYIKA